MLLNAERFSPISYWETGEKWKIPLDGKKISFGFHGINFLQSLLKAKEDGLSKLASLLLLSSKPCTEQAAHQEDGEGGASLNISPEGRQHQNNPLL